MPAPAQLSPQFTGWSQSSTTLPHFPLQVALVAGGTQQV